MDEDGSFKTMKLSENAYALASCNHYKLIQIGNPVYKGKQRANRTTVCYYDVYSTKHRCANKRCSAIRYIETRFPVKHTFKNGKCTVCGRKKKQGGFFMNKGKMMVFSALLMSCFLSIPAGAKSIEKDTYHVCKNDIFIDYDQLNCKKIVTEIKDDGSFIAVNLGDWLEGQEVYDISVIEDDESAGYKKMFYERNPEKEETDEFYDSEDTSYINFQGLVYVGDVIRSTDSFRETITEVRFDGSFYTETEPYELLNETVELSD